MTGQLGTYVTITGGHTWADFDSPGVDPKADEADAISRFGSFMETVSSGFAEFLPGASRPRDDAAPAAFYEVVTYSVKQGMDMQFLHVLEKFTEAAESSNWPGRYSWIQSFSGDEQPTYFLVIPHDNFASFAPLPKEPLQVLEEVYGRSETDGLFNMFVEAVRSTYHQVYAYRPDLSYGPQGN